MDLVLQGRKSKPQMASFVKEFVLKVGSAAVTMVRHPHALTLEFEGLALEQSQGIGPTRFYRLQTYLQRASVLGGPKRRGTSADFLNASFNSSMQATPAKVIEEVGLLN